MNTKILYGISSILFSAATLMYATGTLLNSAQATSYSPSVSMGSNPLFTVGGVISNATNTIITAPNDQIMVVTDVLLTMNGNNCASNIELTDSNGTILSYFKLHGYNHLGTYRAAQSQPSSIQHAFNSGIAVGSNLSLSIVESGSCDVAYTLSGYYAQP